MEKEAKSVLSLDRLVFDRIQFERTGIKRGRRASFINSIIFFQK